MDKQNKPTLCGNLIYSRGTFTNKRNIVDYSANGFGTTGSVYRQLLKIRSPYDNIHKKQIPTELKPSMLREKLKARQRKTAENFYDLQIQRLS